MAYLAPTEAGLGRSCKAKAQAKAKAALNDTMAAMSATMRADREAEERRSLLVEQEARDARHNEAASQPDPWGDMGEIAAVDNPAESVVHADYRGFVSIIVPADSGVPCTECHVQHRGPCSFHDLLRADMDTLAMYKGVVLQVQIYRPEFDSYRAAIDATMADIHEALAEIGVAEDIFVHLRAAVHHVIKDCNRLPMFQPGA